MTNADRAFFEQEITGLLDRLYGAALRLAKNRADAEDLVAETVTRAWANLHTLHDRNCFRGWLFRILTNTFLSECRKTETTSIEALAEAHGETDEEPAFSLFDRLHQPFLLWWGNPEQEFLNKVLQQDLQKAVDALPEVFRVPVILADLQGPKLRIGEFAADAVMLKAGDADAIFADRPLLTQLQGIPGIRVIDDQRKAFCPRWGLSPAQLRIDIFPLAGESAWNCCAVCKRI